MSRSVLKIICVVSGIVFVLLSVLMVVSVVQFLRAADTASVGIIGGADTPTMAFLLHKVAETPVFYAVGATFFLFIGTGLALIFSKKTKK